MEGLPKRRPWAEENIQAEALTTGEEQTVQPQLQPDLPELDHAYIQYLANTGLKPIITQ